MDKNSKGFSCIYHDRIYPSGSRVYGYFQNISCRDGEWHDLDEGTTDSKPSLAYVYH